MIKKLLILLVVLLAICGCEQQDKDRARTAFSRTIENIWATLKTRPDLIKQASDGPVFILTDDGGKTLRLGVTEEEKDRANVMVFKRVDRYIIVYIKNHIDNKDGVYHYLSEGFEP